jgi:hypothetical protein
MHSQSDQYRRRAIQARHLAAQAIGQEVRLAFDEIATHWLALAEQSDWLERYRPAAGQQQIPPRD